MHIADTDVYFRKKWAFRIVMLNDLGASGFVRNFAIISAVEKDLRRISLFSMRKET